MIKVLLVEEQRMVAEGMQLLFNRTRNMKLVSVVNGVDPLIALIPQIEVDVVVTDLDLRDMSGIELARKLLLEYGNIKVIALTAFVKPLLLEFAIYAGICGFVRKHAGFAELERVIRIVSAGGTVYPEPYAYLSSRTDRSPLRMLSERERQIVSYVLSGKTTEQIARILVISAKTVEVHRTNIYKKLGVKGSRDLKARLLLQDKLEVLLGSAV